MKIFKDISFFGAARDVRNFITGREDHDWRVFLLAIGCTSVIFIAFFFESGFQVEYKPPEIIWVDSLDPDRSDQQILLENIDNDIEQKKKAEEAERKAEIVKERYRQLGRAMGMDVDE